MAMRLTTSAKSKPTEQQIAKLAYQLYVAEGCPEGRAQQHWRQAEAMLTADPNAAAPSDPGKTKSGQTGRTAARAR